MKSLHESAQQTAYQEFFKKKLEEYGVTSPAELSTEDKSKFFTEIKKEWPDAKVNESVLNEGKKSTVIVEELTLFEGINEFIARIAENWLNTRVFRVVVEGNPGWKELDNLQDSKGATNKKIVSYTFDYGATIDAYKGNFPDGTPYIFIEGGTADKFIINANDKVWSSLNESLASEYKLKKEGYPITYKSMQDEEIFSKDEAKYIKSKLGDKVILVSEEDRVWGPIDDTLRNQEFKLKETKHFGGRDGLNLFYGVAKGEEPVIYGTEPGGIKFALFQNK